MGLSSLELDNLSSLNDREGRLVTTPDKVLALLAMARRAFRSDFDVDMPIEKIVDYGSLVLSCDVDLFSIPGLQAHLLIGMARRCLSASPAARQVDHPP